MGCFAPGGMVVASQQFGANQTDVFSVDSSGQLSVSWVVGEGAWNGPLKIGPSGIAAPGCFLAASQQFGANQTDVFLVDGNGQLNVFWEIGEGAWNGPLKIGPEGIATPGCFLAASQQFGANQTDVFLVDKNGQLNVFWVAGEEAWNGPVKIGPAGNAPAGAYIAASGQFGANQTDVFLLDKNGQLNVFWVVGEGAWNGPVKIGTAGNAPAGGYIAASQQFGANQTDVFVVDETGQLNVFWVVGEGAWNGPVKIGPAGVASAGSFVAASQQFGANQTDVFLLDKNGQLNVFWVVGEGAWNGPLKIGPAGIASTGGLLATSQQFGANQTDVFLLDRNGQLNIFWVVGEGGWNGPLTRPDPAPPGPLPAELTWTWSPIVFGNGVPVGGNSELTIRQDGTYVFSGHFHDSGATEYNMSLVCAVKDAQNRVYTFEHQGHVSGTFESGSRDDNWNSTGQNDEITQNWASIVVGNFATYQANANGDLTGLLNSILGAVGVVLGVVSIVAA